MVSVAIAVDGNSAEIKAGITIADAPPVVFDDFG